MAAELPGPDRSGAEEALRRLQPQIATVALRSTVAGAQVLLDGEVLGVSPLPSFVVSAGTHELTAKREGYLDGHTSIVARAGSQMTVTLDPVAVTAREAPRRRRWVGPVIGVGAALVVGAVLAATLTVTLSKDYSAAGRDGCHGTCVLFDGGR